MTSLRIAVAGPGLIGRRHLEEIDASARAQLAAIVDPGPAGQELAATFGVPLHRSLADLFARDKPDGVILATPNRLHVEGGLECVAAGVPVIVEKPIGDTVEGATRLVEAGERAGVPVLTGHHRNYSPSWRRPARSSVAGVWGRSWRWSAPRCSPNRTTTSTSVTAGDAAPGAARSCSTSSTR